MGNQCRVSNCACKNGRTDRDIVWDWDSGGNMYYVGRTLAPPVELHCIVHVQRRRGLLSNYFDHLSHL